MAESRQAYSQGEFGEAVRLLSEAQELEPNDAHVQELKVQAVRERDRLRQVREAVASGQRAMRQGQPEVAEQELQRALQLDPANPQATSLLAQVKMGRQERDRAQRLKAGLNQAESLIAANKLDEAGRILAELQQANSNPSDDVKAQFKKLNQWRAEAAALAARPAPVSTQTASASPKATSMLWAEELRRSLQTGRTAGPVTTPEPPSTAIKPTPMASPAATLPNPPAGAPEASTLSPNASLMFTAPADASPAEPELPLPPGRPRP